jgi:hypothetical protein
MEFRKSNEAIKIIRFLAAFGAEARVEWRRGSKFESRRKSLADHMGCLACLLEPITNMPRLSPWSNWQLRCVNPPNRMYVHTYVHTCCKLYCNFCGGRILVSGQKPPVYGFEVLRIQCLS